jgi:hypothetical protein
MVAPFPCDHPTRLVCWGPIRSGEPTEQGLRAGCLAGLEAQC